MSRPVCLYVVGAPPPAVAATFGQFRDWFAPLSEATLEAVDGTRARKLDIRGFAGLVITGSAASLTEPEPWMSEAEELIRRAGEVGVPVLGVCFGHQLVAAAFGGRVEASPAGWEVSTWPIELTEDGRSDPLFAGLPYQFDAILSHRDAVVPESIEVGFTSLARNGHGNQALAVGDSVRGVQFHPEFSSAIIRAYIEQRAEELATDANDRGRADRLPAALIERARDTPDAAAVVANFVRGFVAHA